MKTFLVHYDPATGKETLCGFADCASDLIKIAFDADPKKQDQKVLEDATLKGYLYYTRLPERLVYHSSIENLKGELNVSN